MSTAIHLFDDAAESALEAMGLNHALLAEVCRRGLAQFLTVTPHHPSNASGSFLHFELVRSLRDVLVPGGWEIDDETLSLTLNQNLAVAIAVASGDIHAGNPTRTPSFKYPKGTATHAAVDGNAGQLGLFDGLSGFAAFAPAATPKRVDFDKFKTWWLLHHVDTGKGVMRAELSLPIRIGNRGETNQWESRIILASIPFDEEPDVTPAGGEPDCFDFDVPVRKKA